MPGQFKGKVIPIKVVIGLRPNGHADHPDWTQLPLPPGQKPEDHMNGGWIYDKSSGHDDDAADSPAGTQVGILLVSKQFANLASAHFPNVTKITDEAELDMWLDRCTSHIPEFRMDRDEIQALKAERDLLVDLAQPTTDVDARIVKALDPDDPTPGKRRMPEKGATGIKAKRKVDLDPTVSRR